MANRDKSQKVGFVYTNIYELYKKAQNAAAVAPSLSSEERVWRAENLGEIKITKFEPRDFSKPAAYAAPKLASSTVAGANPFEDLKANMARLQDLHSKLRFMIKELEELVNKK